MSLAWIVGLSAAMLVPSAGECDTLVAPTPSNWSARQHFEQLVNSSDHICEAALDTVLGTLSDERVFMRDPVLWKGEGLPARFEVVLNTPNGPRAPLDRTQGRRYRMFLLRTGGYSRSPQSGKHAVERFVPVLLEPLPVWSARREFTRETVDTIVARSKLDTLCTQAELIVLARRLNWVMSERDGQSVPGHLFRIDRLLKGSIPADTLVYQAAYGPRRTDRALLFLKRRSPGAWEPVWPGAGVFEFDERNREWGTGVPLQAFLERLERKLGPAFVR